MNLIQNTFEKNSSREGIPSFISSVLVFMIKKFLSKYMYLQFCKKKKKINDFSSNTHHSISIDTGRNSIISQSMPCISSTESSVTLLHSLITVQLISISICLPVIFFSIKIFKPIISF